MQNEIVEKNKIRHRSIWFMNMKDYKKFELIRYYKNKPYLEEKLRYGIMTVHNNGSVEIFIPNEPIDTSKTKDFSGSSYFEVSDDERKYKDYLNEQRSLRRTKKAIRNHIKNNKHTHFLTLTFNEKYPTNELRIKRVDTWLKSMRKKYGEIVYCLVFELHKSGLIHVHGAMNLDGFPLRRAVSPRTNKELFDNAGREIFNLKDWDTTGFSTVTALEDSTKASNYITKYVTKDLEKVVPENKKRYRASISNKPQQRYLSKDETIHLLATKEITFENDFGSFIELN